jgi:hypothetical protein
MPYQRAEFFKFTANATEEEIQQHFEGFAALQEKIDVIFSYSAGRCVSSPENSDEAPAYDAFHYATFATLEDVAIYRKHKAHQAFIAKNKDIWESVFVLNAMTE